MISNSVYKHTYDGYIYGLNGHTKQAVKSFTKMYKAGVQNPTQARFAMEEASIDANVDYNAITKNSELKTALNIAKTQIKTLFAYMFNPEYRKAENDFNNAYKKLYPKTHNTRNMIIAERNMP